MVKESEIIELFEKHKFLDLEGVIKNTGAKESIAKRFLKALFNKGILDKEFINNQDYYFLPSVITPEDIKKEFSKIEKEKPKEEEPKFKALSEKEKIKKKVSWSFFNSLMSMIGKEVEVVYFDGTNTHTIHATLKAYEQMHLSLLLENEDGSIILRGHTIVSIKMKK